MAKKAEGQKTYPVNINYFAEKCRAIESAGLNFEFKSENPSGDGVWFRFHHGFSMKSYGEKITVTLMPAPEGTSVHILSQCGMPTQIMDMGKNKGNVELLFQYFESGMQTAYVQGSPVPVQPQPAPVPVQPQPAPVPVQPQPAPVPAQPQPAPVQNNPAAPAFVFCTQCGKKNSAEARFCNACGKPLKKIM